MRGLIGANDLSIHLHRVTCLSCEVLKCYSFDSTLLGEDFTANTLISSD